MDESDMRPSVTTDVAPGTVDQHLLAAATVLYRPDPVVTLPMLQSLAARPRRIYVFINGPIEDTIVASLASFPTVVIIRSAVNLGLGYALNAMLEHAVAEGTKHVLLLDQDATIRPELPEQIMAYAEAVDDSAGSLGPEPDAAFAPLLVPPPGEHYRKIRYSWRDTRGDVSYLPTCGTVISTAAWTKVGPFRADYFIGVIDVEWGFRARSLGYALRVVKQLQIQHRWGPAQQGWTSIWPQVLRQSDERNYYHIRNTIDCLKQPHVPTGWKVRQSAVLSAQIALLILVLLVGARKRVLILRAVTDGVTGRLGSRDLPLS